MNIGMKDYPVSLRPYERFDRYGPEALSDAELLAVILRNGTRECNVRDLAEKVIKAAGGSINGISSMTPAELCHIDGIGKVKARQLICLSEIAKRMWHGDRDQRIAIAGVNEAVTHYMQDLRDLKRENVYVMMLDTRLRHISDFHASIGSVNASAVPVREIIREALNQDAVNIILVHNHPSGDPTPSSSDLEAARELKAAGETAGIRLLDSIIIGNGRYYSFREERQMF